MGSVAGVSSAVEAGLARETLFALLRVPRRVDISRVCAFGVPVLVRVLVSCLPSLLSVLLQSSTDGLLPVCLRKGYIVWKSIQRQTQHTVSLQLEVRRYGWIWKYVCLCC